MPKTYPLLCCLMAAAASAATSDPTLRLEAEWNGRRLPLVAVEHGQMILQDGMQTQVAPPNAIWHLAGDIRANAKYFRWSPEYSISRPTSDPTDPQAPWLGSVWITHDPPQVAIERSEIKDAAVREQFDRNKPGPSSFLEDWPAGESFRGILICAWLIDGRVTAVRVMTEPSTADERGFRCNPTFALTDEGARGQPIVTCWADGRFIAPEPLFDHVPTQAALVDILFDDPEGLEQSIRRARITSYSRDRGTLAHYAAEAGSTRALQVLLGRRASLATTPTEDGIALPLNWAVGNGRSGAVAQLLDTLAQANTRLQPLRIAILVGHRATVGQLLQSDAVANEIATPRAQHPLSQAINAGQVEVAEEILQLATNGHPTVNSARSLLASDNEDSEMLNQRLAKMLVQHARGGRARAVEWLVRQCAANPNISADNSTALGEATHAGSIEMVDFLIEHGANVNQANAGGDTPLMRAAARDRPDLVHHLLEAGADIHRTNNQGFTALHFAALCNAATVVAQLLDAGADLNFCNVRDMTALDTALLHEATDAIDQLIARGACVALGSQYSAALIEAAIRLDVADTLRRAIEDGWPPNSTFAGIWPALRVAQIFEAKECEAVLRAAGAEASANRPMSVVTPDLLDTPLELRQQITPDDPREPAEANSPVTVELQCLIDRNGRVLFPTIRQSPDPELGPAAATALIRQHFEPPLRHGQPVAVLASQTITFPSIAERIFDLKEVDNPPYKTMGVDPVYPRRALSREKTARVEAELIIGSDGRVESIDIVESTGPEFSEAVKVALSQWEYRPGRHRGVYVRVRVRQVFNYTIP